MKKIALGTLTAASVAMAACTDPTESVRPLLANNHAPAAVTHEEFTFPTPGFPDGDGAILLCKRVSEGDPAGTFNFTVDTDGSGILPDDTPTLQVPAGGIACTVAYRSIVPNESVEQVVITEVTPPANWSLVQINTRQLLSLVIFNAGNYLAPRLNDAENVSLRRATLFINDDMARVVTFVNDFVAPPEGVCDFITFGRLVIEVGGQKVVISGNAGGNKPGGGILGEFHIEANGVDNHVADITTYGPITSGALSQFTNSRIVTGTAKNLSTVELRLWDGGEPGKGTDRVYVKIGNTELFGTAGQLIDQGNMQYHPVCRGPDEN
jgi:hypothetical protein